MSRILTVDQAAEKLQMTTKVVRDYLRTGKMPGRKVGKAWRVLETDLELWISTGQTEQNKRFVSARGLLKRYPGELSSAEVCEEKLKEAEIEEAKLHGDSSHVRKSA